MNSAIERLLGLRVEDLMNREVVVVPLRAGLSRAAEILRAEGVGGAPVVDEQGRCVGVLSLADIALRGAREAETVRAVAVTGPGSSRGDSSGDDAAGGGIEEAMSPIVQTIASAAPILAAARLLCQEHIHRLVIVDEDHRPVGVLGSLDLVAAMVAAVEE